ncbi:MAG: hypothetical protein ACREBS_07875, partial [Nitrososphaerales archaeon]
LEVARISGLGAQTLTLVQSKKDELAFLVRVKSVEMFADKISESVSWSSVEIDGSEVKLDIV